MAGCCKYGDESSGYMKYSGPLYCGIISFSRTSLYHGVSQHILDYQTMHQVSEVFTTDMTCIGVKKSDKRRYIALEALLLR